MEQHDSRSYLLGQASGKAAVGAYGFARQGLELVVIQTSVPAWRAGRKLVALRRWIFWRGAAAQVAGSRFQRPSQSSPRRRSQSSKHLPSTFLLVDLSRQKQAGATQLGASCSLGPRFAEKQRRWPRCAVTACRRLAKLSCRELLKVCKFVTVRSFIRLPNKKKSCR